MATKKRTSNTAKKSLTKKPHLALWMGGIIVAVIALVGILVIQFSHASGVPGWMLVDGSTTRHDAGSYVATPDGVAWATNVNGVGPGTWQWYGPFEKLTVWPAKDTKAVKACWTLRDNAPYGVSAEYVLDVTADNGNRVLGSRTVKKDDNGRNGAFKTTANGVEVQCINVSLAQAETYPYDLNNVEYRLSMRRGSLSIVRMSRSFEGTISTNISLPAALPEYIWPLLPGVGSVRPHNDPQGGGCWNDIRNGHGHSGVDILAPVNSVVVASKGGTVQASGNDPAGYGNYIVINGGNGWYTLYGHLNRRDANAGQQVGQGQQIGLSGNTGNAAGTAAHLHFQVQNNANVGAGVGSGTINPLSVLPTSSGRAYNGCTP